jgi:CBS domain-containing protein
VDGILDWMAAGLPTEGSQAGHRVAEVVRRDVPTCRLDEPIRSVRERVREAGWNVCVVVNQEGIVMGLLREAELGRGDEEPVEAVMRPGPSTFRPYVPIATMAHHMLDHALPNSPITTSDGRLVGILLRDDAVRVAHGDHHHPGRDEDEG